MIELTRHGKPVAMRVGCQTFERLTEERRDFAQAYQRFLKEFDLEELDFSPDELFGAIRDKFLGRNVAS